MADLDGYEAHQKDPRTPALNHRDDGQRHGRASRTLPRRGHG
jgi:hypothetical protein